MKPEIDIVTDRLTMTPPVLNNAAGVIFLVRGS
jgi:6-phosphogluconolactonase/glucosamine-6-phosphate isomerase/deaminase